MNRIDQLFQIKQHEILSVYFTAGHPELNSAPVIIKALAEAGVDMIEIGMPFSDPMADGPVIQQSSSKALKNGMSLNLLFEQLKDIRSKVRVPLLLMGYLNPVLQYGMERFCQSCARVGIDGIILPDLPLEVYENEYKPFFIKAGLHNIFLISPQTSEARLQALDNAGSGFLYFVSSSSTTGMKNGFTGEQTAYFEKISRHNLKNHSLIGFGISNHDTFATVCRYASGAIIGSAFVKMLSEVEMTGVVEKIYKFVEPLKGP
ncbi:MAG TPA: tryptophan synthase subunit alpha [Bacteroidales bacterium]|nr:tryptophan synthase subunit alpha [Bacteroidales bacterium]